MVGGVFYRGCVPGRELCEERRLEHTNRLRLRRASALTAQARCADLSSLANPIMLGWALTSAHLVFRLQSTHFYYCQIAKIYEFFFNLAIMQQLGRSMVHL